MADHQHGDQKGPKEDANQPKGVAAHVDTRRGHPASHFPLLVEKLRVDLRIHHPVDRALKDCKGDPDPGPSQHQLEYREDPDEEGWEQVGEGNHEHQEAEEVHKAALNQEQRQDGEEEMKEPQFQRGKERRLEQRLDLPIVKAPTKYVSFGYQAGDSLKWLNENIRLPDCLHVRRNQGGHVGDHRVLGPVKKMKMGRDQRRKKQGVGRERGEDQT